MLASFSLLFEENVKVEVGICDEGHVAFIVNGKTALTSSLEDFDALVNMLCGLREVSNAMLNDQDKDERDHALSGMVDTAKIMMAGGGEEAVRGILGGMGAGAAIDLSAKKPKIRPSPSSKLSQEEIAKLLDQEDQEKAK